MSEAGVFEAVGDVGDVGNIGNVKNPSVPAVEWNAKPPSTTSETCTSTTSLYNVLPCSVCTAGISRTSFVPRWYFRCFLVFFAA